MRLIPITGEHKGRFVIVDDDVFEILKGAKINLMKGIYPRFSYKCRVTGRRRELLLHRVIMGAIDGDIVDHKSTNTLDNRRSNLRFCTASQSTANRRKPIRTSTSKYKGVTKLPNGKWGARMYAVRGGGNPKLTHIGTFTTEHDAHIAYVKASRDRFGDFARCGTREDSFIASEVTV